MEELKEQALKHGLQACRPALPNDTRISSTHTFLLSMLKLKPAIDVRIVTIELFVCKSFSLTDFDRMRLFSIML